MRIPLSPLVSVILFALLCAITAYWALILSSSEAPVAPAAPASTLTGPTDAARTASLFGPATAQAAASAAAAAPVNIRILGVMAPASGRAQGDSSASGVALVSIDGQAARPYAVGETLPNGMRVQAIRKNAVEFIDQGRLLSAPTPPESDTRVLVRGAAAGAGSSSATSSATPSVGTAGNTTASRTFGAPLPGAPSAPQGSPTNEAAAPPPPPPPAQAGDTQSDTNSGR